MKLAAAVVLLAACHHTPVHQPGDEWLESIHLEGNRALADAALLPGLALHRLDQAPDPYLVALDADRIRGQYLRRGFLDVAVTSRTDVEGTATRLTYTIHEGPRAITRYAITGLPPQITPDEVRARIGLADGAPFDFARVERAKPALLAMVKDLGYARAQLELEVIADPARHEIAVALAYTPGPICAFGKVTITGATSPELREAVLARVAFSEGQRYSATAIFATRTALYALQRFSVIQVEADPGEGPVVGVTIALTRDASHEVTLGGGIGLDPVAFEVRGRAGYEITGWPFPLDTVTLDLRPGYAWLRDGAGFEPRMRAIARLERQDFLATGVRGSAEVGYDYLTVEAYTSYGPRAALGLATPLGSDRVQLRAGWAIEGIQFRDVTPLIDAGLAHQLGIDHFERVGAFDQSLIVDLRDNAIEPTSGGYAELRAAEGTPYAGSAYTYFEVTPALRGYLSVGPVVLAGRARLGAIFGEIPPTERFFAGGATSQRGFGERQLSPFVAGDGRAIPYGGAGLAETGAEVRFPIMPIRKMKLGGVVFLDGGDVTDTPGELDVTHLAWAAGVGLRLLTIIGPARVDFGYRLNRTGPLDPEPGSHYAVHFSLGEAF